jgi:predicted transcriptional regulator
LYASITPELLEESVDWATEFVEIFAQQRKVIFQSCQSFLHFGGQPWSKKDGIFDVGMGAYHGAEVCELVGLFMINPTKVLVGKITMKIIDNVVKEIRAKNENCVQAISIKDVLEWFKSVDDKKNRKFINWDIDNFYASINPELLEDVQAQAYLGLGTGDIQG